jgi:hypothetical protein
VFRGTLLLLIALAATARSEPLSKKTDIDFHRDVPSRNLKGLASRSDGRLVAGPTLRELAAPAPADLLWTLEPTSDATRWLVGTGPEGRIVEVTLDAAASAYTAREFAKLDDPQVFALKPLPDGTVLAGTSPRGALYLLRDGKPVARVALPVDSIFDLAVLPAAAGTAPTALVATGNPGRIYRVDLAKFAATGLVADKVTDPTLLAERGITLFGEVRDRNVRRLALLPDGRLAAGSAPRGNIYTFPAAGGPPVVLQENRDAEVTDLLPQPNGDLYAAIVFTSTTNETRITPPATPGKPAELPPPAQPERFAGRSAVVWFPAGGFPETLVSRNNTAIYRLARRADTLLIAGGELGELLGYDLKARLTLTFAGSVSSQLNALVPIAGRADTFLVLRNNAPGLAVLDFAASGPREAETRRLDLGTPSLVGALRFNRLRNLAPATLAAEIRTSHGTDDLEGWSAWSPLALGADGGWRSDQVRARYFKVRLRLADAPADLEIDRATLFGLPQNRRPQLQDFRVLPPNFGVIPAAEPPPTAVASLSQVIAAPKEEDRRRTGFLNSQVVPAPGAQVILWTLADPDGDQLLATFSIRRDGDTEWIELVRHARESYAQFDTRPLADGTYFTRLVVTESAPRPEGERLTHTFETDDLIVDRTAPEILEATARRTGNSVTVTVRGRDRLSLLEGIEVVFNNHVRETLEHPADGIRDGREETFTLDVPLARVANASSLEVTLYDAAGNGTARRLVW